MGEQQPKLMTKADHASRSGRDEFVPTHQELEIYERHLRGEPYSSIGKSFEIDQGTACRAYQRTKKWIINQRSEEVFESRREVEEQYRWIIDECALAWHKSKEIQIVETNKVEDDGSSHTVRKEQTPGDPAYLAIAERALEGRRTLLGLDKPQIHQDDASGIVRYAGKSREEAATEVIAIFRKVIHREEEDESKPKVIEVESARVDGTT